MSHWATAMVAPKRAVMAPIQVTTWRAMVGVSDQGRLGGHERIDSRDEEDAGGDHGGGVDERADGGGAFHGVGQPDVERDLSGFAGCSAEDEDADRGGDG